LNQLRSLMVLRFGRILDPNLSGEVSLFEGPSSVASFCMGNIASCFSSKVSFCVCKVSDL